MITRLQVKNYRCLRSMDLSLGRVTVLVGRNGAGKSTVIDVLHFLRDSLENGIDNAVIARGGFASLRRWSKSRPNQVEIIATMNSGQFWGRYTLKLGNHGNSFRILLERGEVGTSENELQVVFERNAETWIQFPDVKEGVATRTLRSRSLDATALALPALRILSECNILYSQMRGQFYSIFPNTLRDAQKAVNDRILAEDGENFVAILRRVCDDKTSYAELLAAVRTVVEGVSGVRVSSLGSFLIAELQHCDLKSSSEVAVGKEDDTKNLPWFDLSQESDGTVRLLGMLVALYQRFPPSQSGGLLALEEPEIALHPGALSVLRDALLEASRRQQILVTTQSPDLIEGFDVDTLRVVERIGGVSEVGPVDTNQRAVVQQKLFTAGELIRTEGLHREKTLVNSNSSASRTKAKEAVNA